MIVYKVNLLDSLKKSGYNSNRIRKENIMGQRTLQNLRDNKDISFTTLNTICTLLHCQPGDLLEWIPD